MLRHAVTDENGDTITYGYDRANRLTSAVNSGGTDYSYNYDAAYNMTSRTAGSTTTNFTVNAANQVTAAGSTTFTYDGAGNLTGDSTGKQLRYNAANQLTGMKTDASSAMVDDEYAGDGNFERIAYDNQSFTDSVLGTSTRTGGTTPAQSYVRDNTGRLIAIREGTARRYVHADALGSVGALTNESGNLTQSYTYDPYGGTTQTTAAGAINNPWRFTGAYHDTTQSMYKSSTGSRQ
jgi:YD repeat-containing protein